MEKRDGSLIQQEQEELEREGEQPFLFSSGEIPKIGKEQHWNCTGEYLFKSRPDVYKAAVMMLCEPGISIRSICRILHVSHNTLRSIESRESPMMDTVKKGILRTITHGLRLCAERAVDMAPEMSAKDALIGVGILSEKMQLLGGNATAIIEHVGRAEDIYEAFRAKVFEPTMKIIEMGSQMGLAAGSAEQKASDAHQATEAPRMALANVIEVEASVSNEAAL